MRSPVVGAVAWQRTSKVVRVVTSATMRTLWKLEPSTEQFSATPLSTSSCVPVERPLKVTVPLTPIDWLLLPSTVTV